MSTTNFSTGRTQTKTFEELLCSPSLVSILQQESLSFAALNILIADHLTSSRKNQHLLFFDIKDYILV